MPLYEYQCLDCSRKFEQLRSASNADNASCDVCGGNHTRRLLSRFAAHSKGNGSSRALGGGCGSCGGGHCASCSAH
ncbi:MAG: FmdB family zinc ribbon protein [Anaerolineae bacterium]